MDHRLAPRSLRPAEREQLQLRMNVSLARASILGVYSHIVLGFVIISSTASRLSLGTVLGAVWFLLVAGLRLGIARGLPVISSSRPGVWRPLFRVGTLLSSTTWGVGGAVLLMRGGFDRDSELVLLTLAGISAGAVVSLAGDLALLRLHVVAMLAPVVAACLFMPASPRLIVGFVVVVVAYAAFLWVQGGLSHSGLSRTMSDARVAELQAIELEACRRELVEASETKAELLASTSHEIRTPMTAIQGYADLLLDPSLDERARLEHAATIRDNSERLLALLDDILELSKVDGGKLGIATASCSPVQLVKELAAVMRVRAAKKSLALDVSFEGPIPATIRTDPARLRQILTNLVANAISVTDTGWVRLGVRCVGVGSSRSRLSLEVADTGAGLSPEQRSKIFVPFSQLRSSSTRETGGSGLGLAISRRLAVALGGDIRVESLAGRGSSFIVEVDTGPLVGIEMLTVARDSGPTRQSQGPSAPLMQVGGTALVVEDGKDNQVLIGTLLRRMGATVSLAENGRDGVDCAIAAARAGNPFDIILMDMQMPELDGYDATSELRREGYKGAIVALTAHAMAGDRDKCLAAGCDEYLTKPLDRAKLAATVQRFVAVSRARLTSDDTEAFRFVAPPSDAPLVSDLADDPDMVDILSSFVSVLGTRAATLGTAVAGNDLVTLKQVVHQLKGAAGGYGFGVITEQARAVEVVLARGTRGDASELRTAVDALCLLCRRASDRRNPELTRAAAA